MTVSLLSCRSPPNTQHPKPDYFPGSVLGILYTSEVGKLERHTDQSGYHGEAERGRVGMLRSRACTMGSLDIAW